MGATQRMVLGSISALIAVGVIVTFTFTFVLAPLLVGIVFVLLYLLYQVGRRHTGRSR